MRWVKNSFVSISIFLGYTNLGTLLVAAITASVIFMVI